MLRDSSVFRSSSRPVLGTVALVAALCAPTPALAENSDGDAGYAALLDQAYAADGPGATALVVKEGEVLYRGARGMADLEMGVELDPGHVFRLGSITKQFTGAAIMILAEDGELSVDDPITKFLPDYPTHGHTITVEHLLVHTSGVASYTGIPGYMASGKIRRDLSTEELVDVFDDIEMDFAPGDAWNYSNSGYVLLGAIVEAVSGESYADFVQKRIFEPLGMKDSHYGGHQLIPRRVEGYDGGPGDYRNAPYLSMTQPHAAGSLLSTVDDLARWQQAFWGGEVMSMESVARMTKRYALNDGEEFDYGYGYQVGDLRGERMVHHGGGIFGFSTHALWLPEREIFVAVLSNSPGNPTGPGDVSRRLAALAMEKPFPGQSKIEVDAETLRDYVGVYVISDDQVRAVSVEGGRIFTQRNGGERFEVFPFAKDRFFYANSLSYLEFERDAGGAVTTMLMYPNGQSEAQTCPRSDDPEAAANMAAGPDREVASVSPELYDLWAGSYQIQPGFLLELRREGDSLISQATGQGSAELFPASIHRYFLKVVDAEIEIIPGADGRAEAIVLYQGGQEIRAERVE
ncbi:MAG: serine hydrolase [Acidobacteriota bacterium]